MKNIVHEILNKYNNLGHAKRYIDTDTMSKIIDRTSYLELNCMLIERFYHIINDLFEIPKCYCGNNLSWNKIKYRDYCSCKCSANSDNTKTLKIQTTLNKYGVCHNMKLDSCKNARKKTYIENYGVDNPSKSLEVKEKKKQTCLSNYGVETGLQTDNCKQAIFNKFGVYNVMHHPEISELPQRYRWKKYTMPSGKIVNVQGYEPKALDDLLQIYNENDIIIKRKDMPVLWYILPNEDTLHRYYPDIFIPKDNLIIEVKSEYTYKQYITKNKAKEQSVITAGYNYKLLIY